MLALDVRETGIIDLHGYMFSLIAEIEDAGGAVMVNHCFTGGRPISEADLRSRSGARTEHIS